MQSTEDIYLDHSATTPVREEVFEVMLPFLKERFGNPDSLHRYGRFAHKAIEEARGQIAFLIGAQAEEIFFTSGGTEAGNWALNGLVGNSLRIEKKQIIISPIEHPAVMNPAQQISKSRSMNLVMPAIDTFGRIDLNSFQQFISRETAVVSIMHANNETGTCEPISEIGDLCREYGVPFHCDAVQSIGKIPVEVNLLNVDLISISGHKLSGPKGVGALYVRKGCAISPFLIGGSQESGRRAGTLNVAGIVGFGKACELCRIEMETAIPQKAALRDLLQAKLVEAFPECWINGSQEYRLPHLLNIGFPGIEGEAVMYGLDAQGISVSTGSACSSRSLEPSHVLLAMGQDHTKAHSGVRFSLGNGNTALQIERVVQILKILISDLKDTADSRN